MSRLGRKPIEIPEKVNVIISNGEVLVEGPKGKINLKILKGIQVKIENSKVFINREGEQKQIKANHGTMWSLLRNAITGVVNSFKKQLEIEGVGYKAQIEGKKLLLFLGFSKPIEYSIPEGINVSVSQNIERKFIITVEGINKEKVGQVSAIIRGFRKPDPYKLKGIRYVGEKLKKKERKAAAR
ncbi:MAG: 50S ribosomal protein L6 [Acidobacteriota bacterium]